MAEKKTLEERYADEVLTDNTQFDKCRQCKDCIFRDDGTVQTIIKKGVAEFTLTHNSSRLKL